MANRTTKIPAVFSVATPQTAFRLETTPADNNGTPVVVKDILRVGRRTVWDAAAKRHTQIEFTPETLSKLASNFARMSANGNRVGLIWEHDGGAQNRAGYVDSVYVQGDTLYARCSIDERRYQLAFGSQSGETTMHETSPEITWTFTDGNGETYSPAITHLAICLNPVMTKQGPFVRLSATAKPKGKTKMAADTEEVDGEGGESFSVAEVVDMLAKAGFNVPDVAKSKEAVTAAFLALVGGSAAGGAMEEVEPAQAESMPIAQMSMSQRGKCVEQLRSRLSAHAAAMEANDRAAFTAGADDLLAKNRITPAVKDSLLKAGETCKWQLSILAPFQSLPDGAVKTGSPTKSAGVQLSAANDDQAARRQQEISQRWGTTAKA